MLSLLAVAAADVVESVAVGGGVIGIFAFLFRAQQATAAAQREATENYRTLYHQELKLRQDAEAELRDLRRKGNSI